MSRTLLAVFAHPDDESFGPGGTLAKYAAEGVAVHLICATLGEAGESDTPELGECEDLPCRREQELRCAADILGLAEVHLLGYRDSGMAGSPANQHPRALMQADPDVLAEQVADLMRRLRPQVALTFDPFGGYGHPDHIAMHRALALDRTADAALWSGPGGDGQKQGHQPAGRARTRTADDDAGRHQRLLRSQAASR
jgi:LmbE family N-acetylglucosaminyl deacetylase